MKPLVGIQIGSILLLLVQSFFAPMIIGIESFGAQILVLSTAFLAQALIEPAYQNYYNSTNEAPSISLIDLSLLIIIFAIFLAALSRSRADFFDFEVIAIFLVQVVYTSIISCLYAEKQNKIILQAVAGLLVTYVIGFFIFIQLDLNRVIVHSNLFSVSATTVVLFFLRRPEIVVSKTVLFTNGRIVANGLTFRLPVIVFSALFTIVLGLVGTSTSTIGAFRITFSAINAGRYLNLVPPAALQVRLHKTLAEGGSLLTDNLVKSFASYFTAFLLLMTLFFPWFFGIFFGGDAIGSRATLFFSCFYLLLQPMSYAFTINASGNGYMASILNIGVASAVLMALYALTSMLGSPFVAFAISVGLALTIYTVAILTSYRRQR